MILDGRAEVLLLGLVPRERGMYRFLIMLAVIGLLVACTNQGGVETDRPTGSAASTAGGAAGAPTPACEEAFTQLADMQISSLSELGDLPEEVQPTIVSCESVADWIAGAQQATGLEINPNAAATLLRIRCEEQSLADSPVCEEL